MRPDLVCIRAHPCQEACLGVAFVFASKYIGGDAPETQDFFLLRMFYDSYEIFSVLCCRCVFWDVC